MQVLFCLFLLSNSLLQIPDITTYVMPAQTFPTEIRSTMNGISAASGKLGAILGSSLFPLLEKGAAGLDGCLGRWSPRLQPSPRSGVLD